MKFQGYEHDHFLSEKVLLFAPVRDPETCEAARSIDGKLFIPGEQPRLPLRECRKRKTCRCIYIPRYPSVASQ